MVIIEVSGDSHGGSSYMRRLVKAMLVADKGEGVTVIIGRGECTKQILRTFKSIQYELEDLLLMVDSSKKLPEVFIKVESGN